MTPSNPATPVGYIAGNISLAANTVSNLLTLIQQQLEPNCPGTAVEFQIAADAGNTQVVNVGARSRIGGPVSAINWAYQLVAGGTARGYRSVYPGANTPIGQLQLFSTAAAVIHCEIVA